MSAKRPRHRRSAPSMAWISVPAVMVIVVSGTAGVKV